MALMQTVPHAHATCRRERSHGNPMHHAKGTAWVCSSWRDMRRAEAPTPSNDGACRCPRRERTTPQRCWTTRDVGPTHDSGRPGVAEEKGMRSRGPPAERPRCHHPHCRPRRLEVMFHLAAEFPRVSVRATRPTRAQTLSEYIIIRMVCI